MRIMISACLLGLCCRYDGNSKECAAAIRLSDEHDLIPVCPEQLGGLSTPRTPCERQGDKVISKEGDDRTVAYRLGAEQALKLFRLLRCDCAVLKARSPSCGCGMIYDGSFSGSLIDGNGVFAETLLREGIHVLTEEELTDLPKPIKHT